MRARGTCLKSWLLSSTLLLGCPILAATAEAAQSDRHRDTTLKSHGLQYAYPGNSQYTLAFSANASHAKHAAGKRAASHSSGISCVPYARAESGIQVVGNAWQWWNNAQGLYARGNQPEAGSVLNFRANGRMNLGHVAVVSRVVNAREVIIDHANWPNGGGRGGVSRNVAVVDVSEANNWSAVRVELDRDGTFGSVYPTYGFIYNRPDTGVILASVTRPAPQPEINRVPSDLRPVAERPWRMIEEVAEAPIGGTPVSRMIPAPGSR